MLTFGVFLLAIIMALIAVMLYLAIFIPEMAKNAAYRKMKLKEREELDRRMDVEHYFKAKLVNNDIEIPIKLKK